MVDDILTRIVEIVGASGVITDKSEMFKYAHDMSYHEPHIPEIVILPETISQVSQLLKIANDTHTFVTPYGAGTGLEGNAIPLKGGLTLSLQKMNRVLRIDPRDLFLEAEAGITCNGISQALEPYGLWLPTFPGAGEASLGGIISTNASGKWSTLYGCTGDYVLAMEIVLANGDVVYVGRNVQKTVSGYDLKRLFIGSEGTLGIITKATMRLIGMRKSTTMTAAFDSCKTALHAVELIRQRDLGLAVLEFADELTTEMMVDLGSPLGTNGSVLLMEIHTYSEERDARITVVEDICRASDCKKFRCDYTSQEVNRIWKSRDDIGYAISKKYPDRIDNNGEMVVPITRFTELVLLSHKLADQYSIPILVWGHAGQGNLHTSVLGRKDDPKELLLADKVNEKLTNWAMEVGGTSTGEHGVGMSKIHYMAAEHASTLSYMRTIKSLFDPLGIMNPGKMFYDETPAQ